MTVRPRIVVQRIARLRGVPADRWLVAAARAVLDHDARAGGLAAVVIRIVTRADSAALNARFRDRPAPTNVLSFNLPPPPGLPAGRAGRADGDLVLCGAVVAREARAQGKALASHYAHLVVHGTLHLLGDDHVEAAAATAMEARERAALARIGIGDPYAPAG